jgi:hypothetical protein
MKQEEEKPMDSPLKEQIAPEIVQALIAQATASGLTVNEYLARLLGLENGHEEESSLEELHEETSGPRNEAMLAALAEARELLKDMPVTGSTEETIKIIREGRAGRMWGYEPTE